MKRQITHEQAAKLDHYCDICRIISFDAKPKKYYCACGNTAYECCWDNKLKICLYCVLERERYPNGL